MTIDTQSRQNVETLAKEIEGIKFAMLTTISPDGKLHSRPMATQDLEFDGELWFFTGASARKAEEIGRNPRVNVTYADEDEHRWVSITGAAELVRDREKIDQYWSKAYKAWFPQGKDDPETALLKVTVDGAEYWDTHSNAFVHVAGFAKAVATGQSYEPGEHERLDFAR